MLPGCRPSFTAKALRFGETTLLMLLPVAWAMFLFTVQNRSGPDSETTVAYHGAALFWLGWFYQMSPHRKGWRGLAWGTAVAFSATLWAAGMFGFVFYPLHEAGAWLILLSGCLIAVGMLKDAPKRKDDTAEVAASVRHGVPGWRKSAPWIAVSALAVGAAGGLLIYHLSGRSGPRGEPIRLRLRTLTGSTEAGDALAWHYRQGSEVDQDYVRALEWFRWAADKEFAKAEYDLAVMLYYGLGTDADRERAEGYADQAATGQNYAPAYTLLGLIASERQGIADRSDNRALNYWRTAAAQGEPWSEYFLGGAFLRLRGYDKTGAGNQHLIEALYWLEKARLDGVDPIGGMLQHVWATVSDEQMGQVRDEVFRRLSNADKP